LNGLAQGNGASPLYWVAQYQPLCSYMQSLQAQGRITTPVLPSGKQAPVCSTYADDIKVLTTDLNRDGEAICSAFATYNRAGGPALNASKTCAVPLGPQRSAPNAFEAPSTHMATSFAIPALSSPAKLLGVPFPPDNEAACEAAFTSVVQRMRQTAHSWRGRNLNLIGRAHVAKQCLAACAVHKCSVLLPPPDQFRTMLDTLTSFVRTTCQAGEAAPPRVLHPAQQVAAMPARDGGIDLCDLPTQLASLHAKVIARLFNPKRHPWQELMRWQLGTADTHSSSATWAVTAPRQHMGAIALPRTRSYIRCFAAVEVHRIVAPHDMSYYEVMAERVTANRQIPGPHGTPFTSLSLASAEARGWHRLQHVRAARLMGPLSLAGQGDLSAILEAMPEAWRTWVLAPAGTEPPPEWVCATGGDGCVVVATHGPAAEGMGGPDPRARRLYRVGQDGGMRRIAGDVVPPETGELTRWQPAAVCSAPKPQVQWTAAERAAAETAFAEAAAAAPNGRLSREEKATLGPQLFYFLGPWSDGPLHPRLWGFAAARGCIPLHRYTARTARLRMLQLARLDSDPHYRVGNGMRPGTWAMPGAPHTTGLHGLERSWLASVVARTLQGGDDGDASDGAHTPPPRNGPRANPLVAARERALMQHAHTPPVAIASTPANDDCLDRAACSVAPCDSLYRKVWARLRDQAMGRQLRAFGWRLVHGALLCGALHCHRFRDLPAARAQCTAHTCHACPETLTHAFMECPLVRPVVTWMAETWRQLTGETPPIVVPAAAGQGQPAATAANAPANVPADSPANAPADVPAPQQGGPYPAGSLGTARQPDAALILVADDQRAWAPADPRHAKLWTRLRLATMEAVWGLRSERSAYQGSSLAAVAAVRAARCIQRAMERDRLRVQGDIRQRSGACTQWFRGRDPSLSEEEFEGIWGPAGVFYTLDGGFSSRLTATGPAPPPA
jgi:hypothetical protein